MLTDNDNDWTISVQRLIDLRNLVLAFPVDGVRVHKSHRMAPGNHELRWQVMVAGKWRPVRALVGQPTEVLIGKVWITLVVG